MQGWNYKIINHAKIGLIDRDAGILRLIYFIFEKWITFFN
jgi:hypothetical protein